MKNSQRNILRLGWKLNTKYNLQSFADIDANSIKDQIQQHIQTAILNASTQPGSGIMPFEKSLNEDSAVISFNINRTGKDVTVDSLHVQPFEATDVFQPLLSQVQQYFTKNLEVFPYKLQGEAVDYKDFTITVTFKGDPNSRIVALQ